MDNTKKNINGFNGILLKYCKSWDGVDSDL
jgi:hypothetical protein